MGVTPGRPRAPELAAEVLEACRRGDREAFRTLYETYKDTVYSIALHFSGNEARAKDVAQDVFVKLFTALRQFRGESSFTTWLYRLVANACMDEHRRQRRLVPLTTEVVMAQRPGAQMQAEKLEWREVAKRVRKAIGALGPKFRLPILLRYVEGLSYEEIGKVLGCSPGTVASRLNRSHKFLARQLADLRGTLGSADV